MIRFRSLLLLGAVVPMAACVSGYSDTPTSPSGCTADVVPALALAVRDSATQKGIALGVLVTGIVNGKHGTYMLGQPIDADSLTIFLGTISGTYNVTLQKSGYQTTSKTGIVVPPADSLDCHPRTISLDVLMQPTS